MATTTTLRGQGTSSRRNHTILSCLASPQSATDILENDARRIGLDDLIPGLTDSLNKLQEAAGDWAKVLHIPHPSDDPEAKRGQLETTLNNTVRLFREHVTAATAVIIDVHTDADDRVDLSRRLSDMRDLFRMIKALSVKVGSISSNREGIADVLEGLDSFARLVDADLDPIGSQDVGTESVIPPAYIADIVPAIPGLCYSTQHSFFPLEASSNGLVLEEIWMSAQQAGLRSMPAQYASEMGYYASAASEAATRPTAAEDNSASSLLNSDADDFHDADERSFLASLAGLASLMTAVVSNDAPHVDQIYVDRIVDAFQHLITLYDLYQTSEELTSSTTLPEGPTPHDPVDESDSEED